MLNTRTFAVMFALQALVTLTPAAFAESQTSPLEGIVLATGSISTAVGGSAQAQRRLLKDGTELSVLTEYNEKGVVTKRTVYAEPKESFKPEAHEQEQVLTAAQTELAANR